MAYHDHDRRPTRQHGHISDEYSPSTSGAATPNTTHNPIAPPSYLHSSISGLAAGFGGLVRRFSDMTAAGQQQQHKDGMPPQQPSHGLSWPYSLGNGINGVYTPPVHRSISPMAPPPLEPLQLRGFREDTRQRLLTPQVAEEIRIMVPERQRIEDEWNLVYSLDEDGSSLHTLYQKCGYYEGQRASFVLVVRDNEGGLFGAYLSDPPRPQAHYFGNGECFLWRASVLAALPPPPSEDTEHLNASRITTIRSPTRTRAPRPQAPPPPPPEPEEDLLIDLSDDPPAQAPLPPSAPSRPLFSSPPPPAPVLSPHLGAPPPRAATVSPAPSLGPSIRFKAFPYSGENEFYIYCEQGWLSVGGGDGHYGLWLNDSLEKGVSSRCLTFGNEPLSDEGEKFGIVGVEMWLIGRGGGLR